MGWVVEMAGKCRIVSFRQRTKPRRRRIDVKAIIILPKYLLSRCFDFDARPPLPECVYWPMIRHKRTPGMDFGMPASLVKC